MPTAEEKAKGDTPENRRREKALDRSREAVQVLDRACSGVAYGGVEVTRMAFKFPGSAMAEGMVVINGIAADGSPVVAFHSAVGFEQMFVGAVVRLMNGSLKWKEDAFASE